MKQFNEKFRNRTKRLTLECITLYGHLPNQQPAWILGKQLVRSASSVGSNYRAVSRARSEAERFSKLCIVVEEIDETMFWLEILSESGILPNSIVEPLLSESLELTKVFSAYRKKHSERENHRN